jgi:hypothetical protein
MVPSLHASRLDKPLHSMCAVKTAEAPLGEDYRLQSLSKMSRGVTRSTRAGEPRFVASTGER